MDISEKNFEATIEQTLLATTAATKKGCDAGFVPGGYRKRKPDDYHRSLRLDPEVVLDFLYATQPQEWDKLKQHHGPDVKAKFLQRLASEITGV